MMLGPIKTVRARKPHICDFCQHAIPVGQSYRQWVWLDLTPNRVHAHIACDAVANDYYDTAGGLDKERWVSDEPLYEWAREGEIVTRLRALGAHWPDGEMDRLTQLLGAMQ